MPSKKETQVASSNSTGSCPMTAQYAKDTETCTECFKPRVIYREKLTKSEVNDYKRTLEDVEYTCGSPIGLCGAGFEKLTIKENIGRNSPIEIPYYALSNTDICYHCGCSDDMTVADSACPICARCIFAKKKPKKKPKKSAPKIEQVQIKRLIFIIELHKPQIPNSMLLSKHFNSNECFSLNECPP